MAVFQFRSLSVCIKYTDYIHKYIYYTYLVFSSTSAGLSEGKRGYEMRGHTTCTISLVARQKLVMVME